MTCAPIQSSQLRLLALKALRGLADTAKNACSLWPDQTPQEYPSFLDGLHRVLVAGEWEIGGVPMRHRS